MHFFISFSFPDYIGDILPASFRDTVNSFGLPIFSGSFGGLFVSLMIFLMKNVHYVYYTHRERHAHTRLYIINLK